MAWWTQLWSCGDSADDGIGQSLVDDIRWIARFRRCRAQRVVWRAPDARECASYESDPVFGRFGDSTDAIASVDGRTWIVRSRTWHGWPDPPEFVFFALGPNGAVWCARDFSSWPRTWSKPGA